MGTYCFIPACEISSCDREGGLCTLWGPYCHYDTRIQTHHLYLAPFWLSVNLLWFLIILKP